MRRPLDIRVHDDNILVVSNLGQGFGAHGLVVLVVGCRVTGRQDGGSSADDGADGIVHLLALGLLDLLA